MLFESRVVPARTQGQFLGGERGKRVRGWAGGSAAVAALWPRTAFACIPVCFVPEDRNFSYGSWVCCLVNLHSVVPQPDSALQGAKAASIDQFPGVQGAASHVLQEKLSLPVVLVEYMLVKFDHENKKVRLLLCGEEVLQTLQDKGEKVNPNHPTLWRPEYGSYMIEGTPGRPYGGTMSDFNTVQDNMRKRRQEAASVLKENEALCTVTSFPRLGCPGFTLPDYKPTPVEGGASKSLFFPDEAINKHPRFSTLTRNIRHRRGEKVVINVPIFKDKNTPSPFIETFPNDDGEAAKAAKPDYIYMDAMGFGMGNCCLQVTFQACSISEARYLYDQLATICPIVMALSAASPFYRGYVSDIDCRWGVISASVDDRTREERGLEPLKNNHYRISKSRYDSIDSYLSECGEKYNDIDLTIDKDIYEQLIKEGIDHLLAQHIAHLFIRDPLTLFEEKIHLDDANESDHFENIQSTNWQTMRFKPPPPNSDIGWRVEFRPMEVQLTDFENSAYVVFVVLLTRVILSYKLDFLIPLSKVDENMKVAQKRDAVRQGMFYFRKDICKGGNAVVDGCGSAQNGTGTNTEEYTLMSIDTIINGKEGVFPGLIPILNSYLENMEVDVDTRCTILNYLKLIKKRASGELMTVARWMREFIAQHPDYKQDSVITDEINYSLMWKCNQIAQGQAECPELLGVGFNKKQSGNKTDSL
ncbi:PREDICTED: glutamate--cysteine ligase catalytic subunit [Ficedula albicollis]|uniref:glutamate--cysteine ligase catalytic subunit n=1 Tax=Ficedula albicollis TaxID=59894 RepID=UPI00035A1BFF|nr:PREDICTED: glutamate--cysteine ligase catalytic subunit [Ficedula albicollis]